MDRFRESHDSEWKGQCVATARDDLAALEGTGPWAPIEWAKEFQKFLEPKGITFDPDNTDDEQLRLFKKTVIESQWRTLESFEGREYLHRDPAFTELHGTSPLAPAPPKTRTIAELCNEYRKPNWPQADRLRP